VTTFRCAICYLPRQLQDLVAVSDVELVRDHLGLLGTMVCRPGADVAMLGACWSALGARIVQAGAVAALAVQARTLQHPEGAARCR